MTGILIVCYEYKEHITTGDLSKLLKLLLQPPFLFTLDEHICKEENEGNSEELAENNLVM